MPPRRVMTLILICATVVGVDQFSKYLVLKNLELNSSLSLIGSILRLTHIRNPNAAFGLSFGRGVPLLPFALLAVCILLLAFYKTGSRGGVGLAGLSLVLGGALGNLIDRVRFREVVDFVDIGIGKFRWPVFNVADSCVTIGVILLILGSLLFSGKKGSVLEREQSDLTAGS